MRTITTSLVTLLLVAGVSTEAAAFQERRMPPRRPVPIADRARVAAVRMPPLSAGYLAYYGYRTPYYRAPSLVPFAPAPYPTYRAPLPLSWRRAPVNVRVYRGVVRMPVRRQVPRYPRR